MPSRSCSTISSSRSRDLLVDAAEVVAVELLAPAFAQLLEHLAHALDVATFAVLESLLHHAPQRGVQIAVVQEIVGHLLEQRVGVEIEADLRAVPPRVPELAHARHGTSRPESLRPRVRYTLRRMRRDRSVRTSGGAPRARRHRPKARRPHPTGTRCERGGRVPPSGDGNGFGTRFAEDFELYAEYGLTHHRLSIDWARIEPEEGRRDDPAIEHYREVLDAPRAPAGINPWVCLHHFTLPGWFTEIGEGDFLDERARSYYWPRHVAFCAETFGDLVYGWKPINEPAAYSSMYRTGGRSPRSLDWRRVFDLLEARVARAARRVARAARRRRAGRDDPQPVADLPGR